MILVGDIGGTNARLALADPHDFRLHHIQRYPTPDQLPPLVQTYLAQFASRKLSAAALCGAGPLRGDGGIALTNHVCVLDPRELAHATGLPSVRVLNDFEAVAQAIPAFDGDMLRACGGGAADPFAPRLIIGAGTGLGVAALVQHRQEWIVVPGEGGHVDLAPVDDEELRIWTRMRGSGTRISAEAVLSGPGLERLHAIIAPSPVLLAEQIAPAAAGGNPTALLALRLFARWLGRVAGNATLSLSARGGVYIAGGIVPAWNEQFDVAAFRAGFEDKAPHENWMRAIPAWVVRHPHPALLGLARVAVTAA